MADLLDMESEYGVLMSRFENRVQKWFHLVIFT